MTMKTLLLTMTLALAVCAFNVNAAIVETTDPILDAEFLDVGQSHWDINTDLEWLDFGHLVGGSNTFGYSINESVAAGGGVWRLPTYDEVYNLFDTFFEPEYVDSGNGTMIFDTNADSALKQSRNSWLMDFGTDAEVVTGGTDPGHSLLYSTGMYIDENGDVQVMGVKFNASLLTTTIYGPGYDFPLALDRDSKYSNLGVFMVSTHVVPIPAAVWLFGTGLIALLGIARRKS